MKKYEEIKRHAFINELQKIAIKSGHLNDIGSFIKKASFIDETKIIMNYGNGKTSLIKIAVDKYFTPSHWQGISGFHKAVAEDPKDYEINKIKGMMAGGIGGLLTGSVIGGTARALLSKSKSEKSIALAKNLAAIPGIVLGIGGSAIGENITTKKYLNQRGVKKGIISPYSFNQKASEKYLNKEGSMNLDQIKIKAFKDELEKIALRNPVAGYGIKGATVGAGVGSTGAAVLAFKLLKKVKANVPKTPIVAAAAIAGAIAGARAGGGIGAYMGGGVKGTAHLMESYH
jgi:hypothetical protein